MAEFEEILSDVEKKVGGKGILIGAGFLALVFIIMYSRQSNNESEGNTTVVGITGYPDAVTNANVIIDTLQDSIDYSEKNIIDKIGETGETLSDNMSDGFMSLGESMMGQFEATNDYINNGFEAQKEILDMNFDTIIGGIDDLQSGLNNVVNNTEQIKGSISGLQSGLSSSATAVPKPATKPSTTPDTSKPTTSKPTTDVSYYQYKTKAGLNTNQSIVDALKATGVDSSMSNRKKIAEANGITNYTGSYSQNVSLLNKLKGGTLKKV